MRKSNIIVENLLQKRYNEKYLVEKLDDGGMPTRSGKAKKAEEAQEGEIEYITGELLKTSYHQMLDNFTKEISDVSKR